MTAPTRQWPPLCVFCNKPMGLFKDGVYKDHVNDKTGINTGYGWMHKKCFNTFVKKVRPVKKVIYGPSDIVKKFSFGRKRSRRTRRRR